MQLRTLFVLLLFVATGQVSQVQQASAQRPPASFGLYLNHVSLDYAYGERPIERGSGLGLEFTRSLTSNLDLVTAAEVAWLSPEYVQDYKLVNTDVGLRLLLGKTTWSVRPSVGLALNYRGKLFGSMGNNDWRGGAGWSFFGASSVSVAPRWSVSARVGATTGELDHCDPRRDGVKVGCEDVALSPLSLRFRVGLVWVPVL